MGYCPSIRLTEGKFNNVASAIYNNKNPPSQQLLSPRSEENFSISSLVCLHLQPPHYLIKDRSDATQRNKPFLREEVQVATPTFTAPACAAHLIIFRNISGKHWTWKFGVFFFMEFNLTEASFRNVSLKTAEEKAGQLKAGGGQRWEYDCDICWQVGAKRSLCKSTSGNTFLTFHPRPDFQKASDCFWSGSLFVEIKVGLNLSPWLAGSFFDTEVSFYLFSFFKMSVWCFLHSTCFSWNWFATTALRKKYFPLYRFVLFCFSILVKLKCFRSPKLFLFLDKYNWK